MEVYLFSILFILAVVLLLLTFFKKQIIVGIFTGIFFILLGVVLWNGITYVSQTNVVASGSGFNITNEYTEWSNSIGGTQFTDNGLVGTGLILFGLFLLVVSGVMVFSEKKTFNFADENNSNDDSEE